MKRRHLRNDVFFAPHMPIKIQYGLFHGALEAVGHFRMKLNISFPASGCQKLNEVDDERKLRTFYEKRMATEVAADALGEEWKVKVELSR